MSIVSLIDHAVLHPAQTVLDLRKACELGADLGVASICTKPSMVPLATELLAGSGTVPSTVIGFPHGGTSTGCKVRETELACLEGAKEVDMVVNIGFVLAQDWKYVENDIRSVVEAASAGNAITKVIFETGLLPDDALKIRLCEISVEVGAAFVKTSTGFGFAKAPDGSLSATGATEDDVRLMREHCDDRVQIKASGGIRSFTDAERFVALGATRLGTSSTHVIARGELGEDLEVSATY